MRADQLLVQRGLAASRSQAQRLIEAGVQVLRPEGWKSISKSDDLIETAELQLLDASEAKYVSRGGLKLEGALRISAMSVGDKRYLDIGQSTGGFTDCLLKQGAAHVTGVDVGHGQLHPSLRGDPRVKCFEGVNARHLSALFLGASPAGSTGDFDLLDTQKQAFLGFERLVGDVSFISQTLLIAEFAKVLQPKAELLMLVKPQFELQPSDMSKGGIVKDAALYTQVEDRICSAYVQNGFAVKQYFESPITGGDGNREFFVYALKN